ncbi:uncharacterized protein SCHCODRAFT_01203632 [Schizophyllum commune H4-8]|uniref:uncharacterized protein n=1 Tax=Schizophyllum commune (strain H4-8 / FGSC 9210) TaxID=578458 RepID=UPI00215F1A12|nr:uncharacterized protein SCHCODRAFT_01203632 [Schizophyllum commune H4-8]KAI5889631.1 hypothetical protein SCHCODRAFT_01203632 [Schizophyllum commune H4-8]
MSADKKKTKSSLSNPRVKAASKSAAKHAKQHTHRDQRSKHKNEELRSQLDKLMAEGREGMLASTTPSNNLPAAPARPVKQVTEAEAMRNLTTLSL